MASRARALVTLAILAWPGPAGGAGGGGGAAAPSEDRGDGGQDLVDEPRPPPAYVAALRPPWRLVIGFDFGIGSLGASCGGCYAVGVMSLDGFAGVQVSRRVAVLADLWTPLHLLPTDGTEKGFAGIGLAMVAARVWIVPRLWVEGGVGPAGFISFGTVDRYDGGTGALIAVGGEPGHRPCSGIDISLRAGVVRYRDDDTRERIVSWVLAGGVGYHWN